jgi:hypothetical protein
VVITVAFDLLVLLGFHPATNFPQASFWFLFFFSRNEKISRTIVEKKFKIILTWIFRSFRENFVDRNGRLIVIYIGFLFLLLNYKKYLF